MKRFSAISIVISLSALVALGLSACSSGVPQKDVDALNQQLADKTSQLNAATQQLAGVQKDVAAAKQQAALAPWIAKPNAPPRAVPPPPSPGFTPPPAPKPPALQIVPLAFYVDTVTAGPGESQYNVDASMGCVRSGVFERGMHIVWRVRVTDTSSGQVLQGTDVDSALIKIPGQPDRKLNFGRHGTTDTSPWFFSGSWDVPPDYPLGGIYYSIVVTTKSGKTGTFKEMNLDSSNPPVYDAALTIVD
jgi:hypothetical protein